MIGRAHDHKINVFRLFVGLFHRFTACSNRHGHCFRLITSQCWFEHRGHMLRVQHAFFVHHVA